MRWIRTYSIAEVLMVALLCTLVIFRSFFNLELYPRTWFDEGINLQVPKNLLLYGKYATRSSDGFETFDLIITTGPTVLVPIYLLFRMLGPGLLQARLVMGVYLVATILAFYLVTEHVFGRRTALAASFLWVALPVENPFPSGRQVLGEVPAFFFFLLGALLWLQSVDVASKKRLLLAGLLFGLAMVTKSVYVLSVPVLLISWTVGLVYHKRLGWTYGVIPVLACITCVALWYGYQLFELGWSTFVQYIATSRAVGAMLMWVFSPERMVNSARFLVQTGFPFYLGLPALVYVFFLSCNRESAGIKRFLLSSFCGIWIFWYVFASIGWTRYALPALAMLSMFIAVLLSDLSNGFGFSLSRLWTTIVTEQDVRSTACRVAVMLALILMVVHPLQHQIRMMSNTTDRSPQEFATYLDTHVCGEALVESWEWEIDFLTVHNNYHHPPLETLVSADLFYNFGTSYAPPATVYDFRAYRPEYVINGPFAKLTGIYPEDLLEENATLVVSIGEYDLWRMKE